MGDGTEPRGDDILALAEELYTARRKLAEVQAENLALRQAWTYIHNHARHDFAAAVGEALKDFIGICSQRVALRVAQRAADAAANLSVGQE